MTEIRYRWFEMPSEKDMDPARKISRAVSDVLYSHPSTCYLHVKDWQRYCGYTTKEICKLIGPTPCTYRNWADNRHWPNAIWLPHLAKAFGCSIEELFFPPPGMKP